MKPELVELTLTGRFFFKDTEFVGCEMGTSLKAIKTTKQRLYNSLCYKKKCEQLKIRVSR
jgi:hypothetical protein